LVEKTVLT
jgi:hypothetical protein